MNRTTSTNRKRPNCPWSPAAASTRAQAQAVHRGPAPSLSRTCCQPRLHLPPASACDEAERHQQIERDRIVPGRLPRHPPEPRHKPYTVDQPRRFRARAVNHDYTCHRHPRAMNRTTSTNRKRPNCPWSPAAASTRAQAQAVHRGPAPSLSRTCCQPRLHLPPASACDEPNDINKSKETELSLVACRGIHQSPGTSRTPWTSPVAFAHVLSTTITLATGIRVR